MYTENYSNDYDYEDNRRRGFPFKDFILKLILIIIFVLLLMWLIPWPNNDFLKNRVFNDNIQDMKNASLLYFTAERLPEELGQKKTLTLQEMIDLKLILPFVDKNGDSCDTDKSYVTIEKQKNEYVLKVFLKCGEQEDYILVHVGCYEYCKTYLCETKDPAKDKPIVNNKKPVTNVTPKPSQKPDPVKPTPTKPTPEKPTPEKPTPEKPKPPVTPEKPTPPKEDVKYLYEYLYNPGYVCDIWSSWSERVLKNGYSTPSSTYNYQAEYLGLFDVPVGAKTITTHLSYYKYEQVATETYKVCDKYSYEVINNAVYEVGAWKKVRTLKAQASVPNPTNTVKYVPTKLNYEICLDQCISRPVYDIDVYERTATKVNTSNKTVTGCAVERTVNVPIYANKLVNEKIVHTEPIMGQIRKYRERTCNLVRLPKSDLKWSDYNDTNLLNSGYSYTGNKKAK